MRVQVESPRGDLGESPLGDLEESPLGDLEDYKRPLSWWRLGRYILGFAAIIALEVLAEVCHEIARRIR